MLPIPLVYLLLILLRAALKGCRQGDKAALQRRGHHCDIVTPAAMIFVTNASRVPDRLLTRHWFFFNAIAL